MNKDEFALLGKTKPLMLAFTAMEGGYDETTAR